MIGESATKKVTTVGRCTQVVYLGKQSQNDLTLETRTAMMAIYHQPQWPREELSLEGLVELVRRELRKEIDWKLLAKRSRR